MWIETHFCLSSQYRHHEVHTGSPSCSHRNGKCTFSLCLLCVHIMSQTISDINLNNFTIFLESLSKYGMWLFLQNVLIPLARACISICLLLERETVWNLCYLLVKVYPRLQHDVWESKRPPIISIIPLSHNSLSSLSQAVSQRPGDHPFRPHDHFDPDGPFGQWSRPTPCTTDADCDVNECCVHDVSLPTLHLASDQ